MPSNTNVIISARKLKKTYGKKENAFNALRGVDLDISKGESLAIVGKSGSGKSTLMHVLAGLDKVSEGDVLWENQSLSEMREKQLTTLRNNKVGFIFQQFFLQPTMTVLENTTLPLKIAGVPRRVRNKKAIEALKVVGLVGKINNKATDLSGGERQRVAIARALINDPEVIFADEPTGNLDTETGNQVIDMLFGLQKNRGITLVIVTHDNDLAKRCKRIIYIKDGIQVK